MLIAIASDEATVLIALGSLVGFFIFVGVVVTMLDRSRYLAIRCPVCGASRSIEKLALAKAIAEKGQSACKTSCNSCHVSLTGVVAIHPWTRQTLLGLEQTREAEERAAEIERARNAAQ